MDDNKLLTNIISFLAAVLLAALPLFFLPLVLDSFELGKQVLVLVFLFVIFALFVTKSLLEKRLVLGKNQYLFPLVLVLGVFLASTIINSPNKVLSLTANTGVVSLIFGIIFLTLFTTLNTGRILYYSLLAGGVVVSTQVLTGFFFGNLFTASTLAPFFTQGLSLTGSLAGQAVFLFALIPLVFALIYENLQEKKLIPSLLLLAASLLLAAGLSITVYLLTGTNKPTLLPQETAWSTAVEGLKNGRQAIFGLGPGQFVNAFTSFKPLSFNNSSYWDLRFASPANWYFQLLTEVGLLGLLSYFFLGSKVVRAAILEVRRPKLKPLSLAISLSLLTLLLTQFFVPINFFLIFFFIILLTLSEKDPKIIEFDLKPLGNLVLLLLVLPLIIWGGLFYFGTKFSLANYYFLESLKTDFANGVKIYNLQIKAIQNNPYSSIYHIAYSQTNLALANSLAAKKDLTDNDRSAVTQLVQQAIREGKAAVAIDPNDATSWENLANLYRNLLNLAQGADQWTIAAYQQAINLDPFNPKLRIDLGGVYYNLRNYDQAINLFSQAANLKPDFANAHYNLANALKEKGALLDAKNEYEITQSLVKIDTADYQKVTAELEEVKKRIPTPTPTPAGKPSVTETLSIPEPPAAGIKPPLELPNEGPEITPTP